MTREKPRILFITWSFSRGGGAERVLSNLMCALGKTGRYDMSLLEVSHESIAWEPLPDDVAVLPPVLDETNGNPLYRAKRFKRRKLLDNDPGRIREIVRRGKRYDVVVGFNYLYPTFLMYDDEPSISWNHGAIWELRDDSIKLELQRQAYEHIDIIIAIAQRTKESILALYPEYADKLQVVPNGFDFDAIRRRANEQCGQLEGTPILAVGRLDENKDPLRILDAFRAIHIRHSESHLYYLGDGDLREAVIERIAQYKLESCVTLMGYQANPYPLIKQGACLLSMSHSEGFQTVIVEGLALGVPFISTPVGSAEELSCNGRFGKVIETAEEAADAFDELVFAAREEPWHDTLERFVERYTLEQQVESFESLVSELIGCSDE